MEVQEKIEKTPRPITEARKLAKLCKANGYDCMVIVFERPGPKQRSMNAEVSHVFDTPGNMASLFATLWATRPEFAAVFDAALQIRAMAEIKKQEEPQGAKIIGL
jgi:hypothetical protein